MQAELQLDSEDPASAAATLALLSTEQQQLPQALLVAARLQLAGDHLQEAATLLLQIPEDQRTPEILQLLANTLIRSGHTAEAREILSRLIEAAPASVSFRIERLKILSELEAWEDAQEDAEIVLLQDPDSGYARLARGMLQAIAGNQSSALEDLESDTVRALDTPAIIWTRARCLLAVERSTQAAAELTRLLELAPEHDAARLARADLEFARGNNREASADYSLLLKKQPHDTELLLKRARLLLKVGRCDAAETDLLQLLRLQPLSAEAWHLRGLARSRLGLRDEARRDLERSLRLNAQNTACLFDLADLEAADGRTAAALTLYDAALQLKPDNAIGWYNRGLVLYRLGRHAEAVEAWSRSIDIRPTLDRAWSSRAAARSALGQHSEARRDVEQVLALRPGDPQAWEQYARLLIRCPDPAVRDAGQAVRAARKACELSQFRDWKLMSLLAESLEADRQPALALKWAEQARRAAPATQRTAPAQLVRTLQNRVPAGAADEPDRRVRTATSGDAPARF